MPALTVTHGNFIPPTGGTSALLAVAPVQAFQFLPLDPLVVQLILTVTHGNFIPPTGGTSSPFAVQPVRAFMFLPLDALIIQLPVRIFLQLEGILEEGGLRCDDVLFNARQPISMPRSANGTIQLRVLSSRGNEVDLAGTAVQLVVKKKSSDSARVLTIPGTLRPVDGPGRADFVFMPDATSGKALGRYVFDVSMTGVAGLVDVLVPVSQFVLEPE